MIVEKVTLPREVAEAIELMRRQGSTNFGIMTRAYCATTREPDLTIRNWAHHEDGKGSSDKLMRALINGYEVEKSPEEKVFEYYKELQSKETTSARRRDFKNARYYQDQRVGMFKTLNLLGIAIEGVNAYKTAGGGDGMTDSTVNNKAYCAICAFTENLTEHKDIYLCRRCDDKYAADSTEEGADADE